MSKYQHHICFVSDQNVAELLGALLPESGASRLHAVVTPKMAAKGENLEKTCRKQGVKCELHELARIDMEEIDRLLDAIRLRHPGESWAVNITGGTKIMTLAAYDWATRNNVPAIYIDTGSRTIRLCENTRWQSRPLPAILGFEALLNLYGYDIVSKIKAPVPFAVREATEGMIELASGKTGARLFHALNDLARSASCDPDLVASYCPSPELDRLLDICKGAGKLDYASSRVIFRDEPARKWCGGIWLEEFVQAVLARLEGDGKISSWASSVKVNGKGGANELDAIFTANNCLHVLECKTAKMKTSSNAVPILYKADSLRDRVGGIFTKSMLCSLDELTPDEARRAKNLGIRLVIGANLKNLRKILSQSLKNDFSRFSVAE